MSSKKADKRPEARLPKGMRDIEAPELRAMERMLGTIRRVYESYGFEPLDTPAFEYTDALGKFLPDQDRPNEGVFSFQDEDEQWLSLRYDLTAPLARYVAQNFDGLPKPFRRYQTGPVWRNEKPGPGRFRQFTQFDADTVGTDNVAADAELCMLAADAIEALGIPRGSFVIRVNSRRILDGVMTAAGLGEDENARQRLTVLRAIDKLDRLGIEGVRELLGAGRKDESGDFTKGAGLNAAQIAAIEAMFGFSITVETGADGLRTPKTEGQFPKGFPSIADVPALNEGLTEVGQIIALVEAADYGDRVRFDPTVVRGLEYYTGPVIEAELTFEATDESGAPVRFGSVGGGGRYDGLVSRFKGTKIPATGFSIGVSRLYSALQALGKLETDAVSGPVVILAMDKARLGDYNRVARTLREANIRAEIYLGTSGMKAQMKYADKRGAPCVVIQGGDELARGEVTIKDLIEGDRLSGEIADHQAWREGRPAQFSVKENELVEAVRSVLARHAKASG
ncbi:MULTISPECIES: histidine--tRNA ligase [Rhodomicrobium]|uniref:histidine--tRNA ligase n=1 Tax=Rhodomicrobium TaxID=1068 RepID=UPI000B4AB724|nr:MULTISPECIES: histidine--tRNA ligase [Rhodomicrobium]